MPRCPTNGHIGYAALLCAALAAVAVDAQQGHNNRTATLSVPHSRTASASATWVSPPSSVPVETTVQDSTRTAATPASYSYSHTATVTAATPVVLPLPGDHRSLRDADVLGESTGLPPAAATAVVAVAYTSSAVASHISPTAGTKATNAARLARHAATCGVDEVDAEDAAEEWPERFPLLGLVVDTKLGDSSGAAGVPMAVTGVATGAVLLVAALTVVATAALLQTHDAVPLAADGRATSPDTATPRGLGLMASGLYIVATTYLGPSITAVCVAMLAAGASTLPFAAMAIVVVGFAIVLALGPAMLLTSTVLGGAHPQTAAEEAAAVRGSTAVGLARRRWALLVFYEDARDRQLPSCRAYGAEDLCIAHALAACDGVTTGLAFAGTVSVGTCRFVGIVMVLLTLVHLAYLVLVRPMRGRLDMVIAVMFGVGQMMLAVFAFRASVEQSTSSWTLVGWTQLVLDVAVFATLLLLAVAGVVQGACRKKENGVDGATTAGAAGQQPLLHVPVGPHGGGGGGTSAAAGARPDDHTNDEGADVRPVLDAAAAAAVATNPLADRKHGEWGRRAHHHHRDDKAELRHHDIRRPRRENERRRPTPAPIPDDDPDL